WALLGATLTLTAGGVAAARLAGTTSPPAESATAPRVDGADARESARATLSSEVPDLLVASARDADVTAPSARALARSSPPARRPPVNAGPASREGAPDSSSPPSSSASPLLSPPPAPEDPFSTR